MLMMSIYCAMVIGTKTNLRIYFYFLTYINILVHLREVQVTERLLLKLREVTDTLPAKGNNINDISLHTCSLNYEITISLKCI